MLPADADRASDVDGSTANFQPFTSYRWPKKTSKASQFIPEREDKLKQLQPNGRMLIHVSSQIEKWQGTQADVEVRSGDTLYIPKRPTFVMVAGQVYNPIAITFSTGKHAGWYLKQAGGPTTLANKKEIFVVRANGTVVGRGSGEWWSGNFQEPDPVDLVAFRRGRGCERNQDFLTERMS